MNYLEGLAPRPDGLIEMAADFGVEFFFFALPRVKEFRGSGHDLES